MVAVNNELMHGAETIRRRRQPLVNNLYQGMTLDAVTGLCDERARDYSPSLGRWMEEDPAQFINGANTYQFVDSSPVGNVGAQGNSAAVPSLRSLTLGIDLGILQDELAYFKASGYTMAAALLQGFLGNRNGAGYPGGSTNAFNTPAFPNEVKGSKDYRIHASRYLRNYIDGLVQRNRAAFPNGEAVIVPIPKHANIYIQFYFDFGYGDSPTLANDLMYAFGGLVFNFSGRISVTRCHDNVTWPTRGLYVKTDDNYNFPVYTPGNHRHGWSKLFFGVLADLKNYAAGAWNAFDAGYSLQHTFGYKSFYHPLNWTDSFSGKFSLSTPPPNYAWIVPSLVGG